MESYWSDAPDFEGSKVSEEWVQTNENVRLRVITWTPDSPTSAVSYTHLRAHETQ